MSGHSRSAIGIVGLSNTCCIVDQLIAKQGLPSKLIFDFLPLVHFVNKR